MATTYNATLNVNCIKQHTCVGCNAEFQYRLERSVTGSGGTQEAAAANAEKAAIKALENDVDQHACPHCGMMQPDMIAASRKSRFVAGLWLAPVIILIAFFIALPHWITISTSALIAAGGVALAGLIMVSGAFYNPNKDMSSGQMESSTKVDSGILTMTKEGNTATSEDYFGALSGGHWTGLTLIGVALIATLSPLVLPGISGWETNDTYPCVVGPGDETTVYFDQKIKSLQGMWNGTVQVKVKNADELGGQQIFRGSTKNSNWGNEISGESVSDENNTMYVELSIPDSADLAGKTANLDFTVHVSYPISVGADSFDNRSGTFNHSESLKLSAPGSGTTYWQSWIYGQLGAVVLMLVGGFIFLGTASGLVKQANTPNILVDDGGAGDDSGDDGFA